MHKADLICLLCDYLFCESADPEEEKIKVRQRRQSKKMSTTCFSRMRKSEIFGESISNFLFRFLFPLPFFFISGFLPTLSSFLHGKCLANFLEKGKI